MDSGGACVAAEGRAPMALARPLPKRAPYSCFGEEENDAGEKMSQIRILRVPHSTINASFVSSSVLFSSNTALFFSLNLAKHYHQFTIQDAESFRISVRPASGQDRR